MICCENIKSENLMMYRSRMERISISYLQMTFSNLLTYLTPCLSDICNFQVIRALPGWPFSSFSEKLSNAGRAGDSDLLVKQPGHTHRLKRDTLHGTKKSTLPNSVEKGFHCQFFIDTWQKTCICGQNAKQKG